MAKDVNTEQALIDAAEKLFVERGFDGARTTEIAKLAGVNHAMLHYYFGTKERLFELVFERKIDRLVGSITNSFGMESPFFERIELAISTHFDFIMENPRLFMFIYNHAFGDEGRKELMKDLFEPRFAKVVQSLQLAIDREVEKDTIREINAVDLLLNIVGINLITIISVPIIELMSNSGEVKRILVGRRKTNIEFVINAIKK